MVTQDGDEGVVVARSFGDVGRVTARHNICNLNRDVEPTFVFLNGNWGSNDHVNGCVLLWT